VLETMYLGVLFRRSAIGTELLWLGQPAGRRGRCAAS
jgi:hypothetical protein